MTPRSHTPKEVKLRQCLHIHSTKSASLPLPKTKEDKIKLKHHNTFMPLSGRKSKTDSKDRNPGTSSTPGLSDSSPTMPQRYKFDSLDSYHRFNEYKLNQMYGHIRIPVATDMAATGVGQGQGHDNNVESTEEKQRKAKANREVITRMASAKYSDIAVLKDLDEYFTVTTPRFDQRSRRSLKSGKSSLAGNVDVNSDAPEEWKSEADGNKQEEKEKG